MIGHELGGRYQIIERIGGGGMALVYRAHDILLNRNVAVKILRGQFVHDEEFIRRFRREAQSAASLSHPNVVSIYDVGQEDDTHYIVMEYVEGKNLNEIIKERAPLQVDEAVRIASQICDALEHAHQSDIIHRDIKPHNILIGRNGRVKVTDFGIARAVTSTTITQTGSVVGSVHYFSPEHAKGVAAGAKSDLYSLGIVLYQMLTGNLPFLGESPISVALKHLQEEFEEPRVLNPMIPQSVENIILKSMRKNPDERYQSAKEMLRDLETCLLPERRSEAKLQFDEEEDEDRTRIMPAIKPIPGTVPARIGSSEREERMRAADTPPGSPPRKKWVKPSIWIGSTLLLLAVMFGIVWYVNAKLVVPEVPVPKVIGLTEQDARAKLEEAGIEVVEPVTREYNPNVTEGYVFKQSKEPESMVKKGYDIILTVGAAKPLVKMTDVTGMSEEEAVQALIQQGVEENRIKLDPRYNEETPEGDVISQDPAAGSDYDPDTAAVTLIVSKGKESVEMPDLKNLTVDQAKQKLEKAGLTLDEIQEEASFEYEAGKITAQWPYDPGAEATPGEKIKVTVSTGYPPEAFRYTFNLPVEPVEPGGRTKIRIEFADARNNGEKQEWGTRTVGKRQTLAIEMLLAPNKDGVVYVYHDGEFFDTYPVTYVDAKNGTVPIPQFTEEPSPEPTQTPEPTPPASPEATVDPAMAPGAESTENGEGGGNQTGENQTGGNNAAGNNAALNGEANAGGTELASNQVGGQGNGHGNGHGNGKAVGKGKNKETKE